MSWDLNNLVIGVGSVCVCVCVEPLRGVTPVPRRPQNGYGRSARSPEIYTRNDYHDEVVSLDCRRYTTSLRYK